MTINNEILVFVDNLRTSTLIKIGRTCDMVELTFQKSPSCVYAIHIFSPFRLSQDNEILVSNMDIFLSNDLDYEYTSRARNSIFDQKVNDFSSLFSHLTVSSVVLSAYGDLTIDLKSTDNVAEIQVFNNVSDDDEDESWRVFRLHSNECHAVCYRNRFVFE